MADVVSLALDAAKLQADGDKLIRRILTVGTLSVGGATKQLERDLEAATRAAVPGNLWKAWASEAYPRSGPARDPVGQVYVNGRSRTRGAIAFWTQPGSIRGSRGQYLAVPLPAAGSRGRQRDLTPGEWERRTGRRLRFVYRPGRPSLLVADDAVLGAKNGVARGNTARRIAAGRASATVPIFVLLPTVRFRNAVAVEPLVAAAGARMVRNFIAGASAP